MSSQDCLLLRIHAIVSRLLNLPCSFRIFCMGITRPLLCCLWYSKYSMVRHIRRVLEAAGDRSWDSMGSKRCLGIPEKEDGLQA